MKPLLKHNRPHLLLLLIKHIVLCFKNGYLLLEFLVLLGLEETLLPEKVKFSVEFCDHIIAFQFLIDVVILLSGHSQLVGQPVHNLHEHSVEWLFLMELELVAESSMIVYFKSSSYLNLSRSSFSKRCISPVNCVSHVYTSCQLPVGLCSSVPAWVSITINKFNGRL